MKLEEFDMAIKNTNKIEIGDYQKINTEKHYLNVILTFDKTRNELDADITIKKFNSTKREDIINIKIYCEDKTSTEIINEFEANLKIKCDPTFSESVVIIYKPIYFVNNLCFKKIIDEFKNLNIRRKEQNINSDIFYEYIIDDLYLWSRTFSSINTLRDYNYTLIDYIPLYIMIERSSTNHINFCINSKKTYYFFEVSLKELEIDNLKCFFDINSWYSNSSDARISEYFIELYKYVYIDNLKSEILRYLEFCTINKIQSLDTKFTIEINNDEIKFSHNLNNYTYSYNKNLNKKCFYEFQDVLSKIVAVNLKNKDFQVIELFFRLINSENEVEFLINRLLGNPGTALHLIFIHTLLYKELIKENEMNKLMSNEIISYDKKKLLDVLSDNVCLSCSYLIKVSLFIEAEKYINENDCNNESIFGTLKKIGYLMKNKKRYKPIRNSLKFLVPSQKGNLNLVKIYIELVKYRLEDIKKFNISMNNYIYNTLSLLTLDNSSIESWNISHDAKKDVFKIFGLSESEIEKNLDLIKKSLLKKQAEEFNMEVLNPLKNAVSKYQLRSSEKTIMYKDFQCLKKGVKNILSYINKIDSNEKISLILYDAKKRNVGNLFDNNVRTIFENELKIAMKITLTNVYKSNEILISQIRNIVTSVDKDLIDEYKKEEELKLYQHIQKNIQENARKNSIKYFPKVLIELFESIVIDDMIIKTRCKNNLEYTLSLLTEQDLLEIVNNTIGEKIHNKLVNILLN
ncbi:uncharacterized protein VNE69_02001 [Vairimorpha necatrix]|uniref:Uncharacterized protein n=1 Tax=Vairimorpha necatrix TaxID=6039 RepID=A0AAX4J914_9MICR